MTSTYPKLENILVQNILFPIAEQALKDVEDCLLHITSILLNQWLNLQMKNYHIVGLWCGPWYMHKISQF